MLFAAPQSLFRMLAIGDIKCVPHDARFPLERNQSGAEVDPALFPRLGDDLEFVAVLHFLSAETCSRTLPHWLSIIGMNDLTNVTCEQFVTGVAQKLFGRAIHIEHPAAIMDEDGVTAYFGNSAELFFGFAQCITLLQELTFPFLTAS